MDQPTEHDDEFAGQGGSYVIDPITKKRTLVERTESEEPKKEEAVPPSDAGATPTKSASKRTRV